MFAAEPRHHEHSNECTKVLTNLLPCLCKGCPHPSSLNHLPTTLRATASLKLSTLTAKLLVRGPAAKISRSAIWDMGYGRV